MSEVEFKAWEKIPRDSPFKVTITEKIDGTNSCIVIKDGEIVGVQSRKRFIFPEDDNYGFATWVRDNHDELLSLGDGYHYGEWAGEGIQKNHHMLTGKQFFLFNTFRWNPLNPNRPDCCKVVPILFEGELSDKSIDDIMIELLATSKDAGWTAEGIVVYYHAFRKYTKHTYKYSEGKWREGDKK